jgi:hypothetical protein
VAVNTEYTIRYYRSQEWAERFTRDGIHKSASWVTSRTRYAKREEAQRVVDHINSLGPDQPVELVTIR